MRNVSVLHVLVCVCVAFAQAACGGDDAVTSFDNTGGSGGTSSGGSGGTSVGGSGGNGGTSGVGGSGVGGSGVGGSGGTVGGSGGTGGSGGNCGIEIVAPEDGAVLTEDDDADQDCENGFDIDVRAAVQAADGEVVELSVNGSSVPGEQEVSGPTVTFEGVSLNANASNELTVSVGDCTDTISVTTECEGVPTCEIVSPSAEFVNGIPAEDGGYRTSPDGAPYAIEVQVASDIGDGEVVSLTVDGYTSAAAAFAYGGTAVFEGVELVPDGVHTLRAVCRSESGRRGQSAEIEVTVDSEFPDLDVVGLENGQHFSPDDDVDPNTDDLQFDVCGVTEAADAVGISADNFCVAIGSQSPTCIAASDDGADGESGGCVRLTCPGNASFDLAVSVEDEAGNLTVKNVAGVSCASAKPTVQLITPTAGSSILAASMPEPHDEDANASGAQVSVVACTSSTAGTGTLLAGLEGEAGDAIATASVEPAESTDDCPAGLMNVVRFSGVTLPESSESTTGQLVARTVLQVEVEDESTEVGLSGNVDLWVDSVAPSVVPTEPRNLCGRLFQSASPVDIELRFSVGSTQPLDVTVTPNGGSPASETFLASSVLGLTEYKTMSFALGLNEVAASITEPSGNQGFLQSPCVVTVGNPPVVTWQSPTSSSKFNASTDADPDTAGWQGDLNVEVTNIATGGEVRFSVNGSDVGSPITIQPDGSATLSDVTIPEGASVTLTATTNDLGEGAGSASIGPFVVDVTIPDAVTGLSAGIQNRRQTAFRLEWTIPADGEGVPSDYLVRVAEQPIDGSNFDSTEDVTFADSCPGGGTACVDVRNRVVEREYYFAVAPIDAAGNQGAIVAAGPAVARLNTTVLTGQEAPGSDERFGIASDGSTSINGDAYSDLVVGGKGGNKAYIWFGSESGYAATPSVTITGPTGLEFGRAVAVVGDIDSDGFNDIAIGAPSADGLRGRVYVIRGRASWPATIDAQTQADTLINTSPSDPLFTYGYTGVALARLGDFNNDGYDDFAVAADGYNNTTFNGYVAIILGGPDTTTGWDLPSTITLPDDVGTSALAIKGTVANGALGWSLLGLGGYFGLASGDALVAGAMLKDIVYAFAGQEGDANGEIAISEADDTLTGAGTTRLGNSLALVGSFAGRPALAVGNPRLNAGGSSGRVFVHFGAQAGPFSGPSTEILSTAFTGTNRFGYVVLGSGVSGTSITSNLLGSAVGDLAVTGNLEAGGAPTVYLMSGETVRAASGTTMNAATDAEVAFPLSGVAGLTNWRGASFLSSTIQDCNGDGFADLAIGEYDSAASAAAYDGRVVVIW